MADRWRIDKLVIASRQGRSRLLPVSLASVAATFAAGATARASLVITPIYDASIASDPQAAVIEGTINSAIQVYETTFTDDIAVSIKFQEGSGLGSSSTFYGTIPYTLYRSQLQADATSADDNTALAHLPNTVNNPVDNNPNINVTTANLKAIGFTVAIPANAPDSTITLNTSIMNLTRNSIDPSKYDLMSVVSHEIDEALGFGSALNGLSNSSTNPTGAVFPEDLFRYDQNGNRTLSTSASSQAYFSIDGTTKLARFNQNAGGDFSDWYSIAAHTPQVQDAFGTAGATPDLGVELRALDVIGYDRAVPEPASVSCIAFLAAGTLLRRRRA